ncbi:dihydrodipicolinate synthase family protein [Streptomyces sp. A7024]|uniref:Dihydrodipicolinate synthase family protein n=1 Tax=Streptomyces coryli TaxID=1128680 RepID=A0A6G4TVT5_9ACTN|nr:dihydrodipicolinate synthase family protein [Streptomyces coryli]NGN63111.1 dihydrodipicolinate synthase family protein [Streptomyces coryli]
MSRPVRGLVPVLATPFAADGSLDRGSLRRLTEWQLGAGADGVAVFGMASEGFALTAADRAAVLADVTAVTAGAVPVVAGVSPTSLATALEQTEQAVAGGADALMVLPPYLAKPNAQQLVDFYGAIGERAGVHVMVQDAAGVTGVPMPVSLITEFGKLAGVDSVKVEAAPTAPKIDAVVAAAPEGFEVLGGQNAFFLLEELAAGAVGTMPACEFTDVLRGVLDDWTAGRTAAAHATYERLLPLIRFGMQPGLAWAVHKEVLVRRGIIEDAAVRMPARELPEAVRGQLDGVLERLALPAAGLSVPSARAEGEPR